jgi:hypothetical protein
MGHKTNSEIYSHYQSRVSGVDLQATYRDFEQHNLQHMLSIRLNSKNNAPTRISDRGYQAVLADSGYVALDAEVIAIETTLRAEYGSIAAASRALDPRFEDYKSAHNQRRVLRGSLIRMKFQEEYETFFSEATCPQVSHVEEPTEQQQLQSEDAERRAIEFRGKDFSDTTNSNASATRDIPIDPRIISEGKDEPIRAEEPLDKQEDISRVTDLLGTLDYEDDEDDEDDVGAVASMMQNVLEYEDNGEKSESDLTDPAATSESTLTTGLHGLPNKPLFPCRHAGSSRYYVGSSVCEGLYETLTASSDEGGLARKAIECFSVTHKVDMFFPGQEPFPGTFSCRICNVHLTRESGRYNQDIGGSAWRHALLCSQKVHLEAAQRELEERCAFDQQCRFVKLRRVASAATLTTCGHISKDWSNFFTHTRNHTTQSSYEYITDGKSRRIWYCFFEGCAHDLSPRDRGSSNGNLRTDPQFDSLEGLYGHIAAVHDVIVRDKKVAEVVFCHYCETWLGPFDDPVAHTMSHEIAATELVKTSGYEAPTAGRLLRPDLCIFCYHDHDMPLYHRIVSKGFRTQEQHLRFHLSTSTDASISRCPAYPEMCSCDTSFSKYDLLTHLNEIHGISAAAAISAKRKRADSRALVDKSANTSIKPSKSAGGKK